MNSPYPPGTGYFRMLFIDLRTLFAWMRESRRGRP